MKKVTAALAALVPFIMLASCAAPAAEAPKAAPATAFGVSGQTTFWLDDSQALSPLPDKAPESVDYLPFPLRASVAGLASSGRKTLIALNRVGFAVLVESEDSSSFSLATYPRPELFADRSVGAAFSDEGRFLVNLYHHPFFETAPERDPVSILVELKPDGKASRVDLAIDRRMDKGWQLFALVPLAREWLGVRTREESEDRTNVAYLAYDPAKDQIRALEQGDFESALRPGSIADAPAALRAIAASGAFGKGPLFVEAASLSGKSAWTDALAMGEAETGDEAYLYATIDGDSCVAVSRLGKGVSAEGTTLGAIFTIALPSSDARVTGIAMAGALLVASWEESDYPDLGRTGIAVMKLP